MAGERGEVGGGRGGFRRVFYAKAALRLGALEVTYAYSTTWLINTIKYCAYEFTIVYVKGFQLRYIKMPRWDLWRICGLKPRGLPRRPFAWWNDVAFEKMVTFSSQGGFESL